MLYKKIGLKLDENYLFQKIYKTNKGATEQSEVMSSDNNENIKDNSSNRSSFMRSSKMIQNYPDNFHQILRSSLNFMEKVDNKRSSI